MPRFMVTSAAVAAMLLAVFATPVVCQQQARRLHTLAAQVRPLSRACIGAQGMAGMAREP